LRSARTSSILDPDEQPQHQSGGRSSGPGREDAPHARSRAGGRSCMSRVAVVTGAASGMGLGIARHLAAAGRRVALLDLDGDTAEAAADELGRGGATALSAKVDVSDRGAVDDAIARVRAELGPIEILVTSAGLDEF